MMSWTVIRAYLILWPSKRRIYKISIRQSKNINWLYKIKGSRRHDDTLKTVKTIGQKCPMVFAFSNYLAVNRLHHNFFRTAFRREPNFTTHRARRNCRELFRFHLQWQSSEQSGYALYVSLPQSKFGRSMRAVRKTYSERSLRAFAHCKNKKIKQNLCCLVLISVSFEKI